MDPIEVIIARLVLGYLKEEKCRTAYKEFLKTSNHLKSGLLGRSKYLPTRFVGLTLEDILSEYFEISTIVQGRLEATNYYKECHTRTSLVQQLLYLLNKGHSSRTSTPCPRSPIESNVETSPSLVDHISDVETTPIHTLPGNVQCTSEESYLYKTPRRKSSSKLNKPAASINVVMAETEDMSEVLAHTLLENKEFHEKIAQTINKVAEKQYRVSSELDKTIKHVVKATEADPIFDKILDEIIGSTSLIENCKNVETSSSTSSVAKEAASDINNKSKRIQKRLNTNESVEDSTQVQRQISEKVDQQNEEAIRSIVAKSKSDTKGNDQEIQVNNEVTIFDGTLDKYLMVNTCNATTQTQLLQNPLYINTTGSYINSAGSLLMVPTGVPSSGSLQVDPTKPLYVMNNQTWNIPPIKTPNVLSERDILTMPTVIVNDDRKVVTPHEPTIKIQRPLQSLIPKPTIEVPLGYINPTQSQHIGLKNVIYPKTREEKIIDTSDNTVTKTSSVASNESKSMPSNLLQENEELVIETVERVQKTPKSGSHVRNLDFSSPPKLSSTNRKSVKSKATCAKSPFKKKQIAKFLCKSENSTQTDKNVTSQESNSKTWDADLRANIVLPEDDNVQKKKKTMLVKKVKNKGKKTASIANQLDNTERSAALIEAALETPVKSNEKNEDNDYLPNNCSDVIENKDNLNKQLSLGDKINSSKKLIDLKGCKESDENNTVKMVVSPSKLNASKRKFINSDDTDCVTSLGKPEDSNKFVTPEMCQDNFHYPIKANRNITPMFESPAKNEFLPKTPGIQSPNTSLNTPFTKMLEANLKGIDISSLPTPSIPITPNFPPFTPNINASPFPNRPTDYSTSSSYYQPSDSEPNRSLEANVIEFEKQHITVLSNVVIAKSTQGRTDYQSSPDNKIIEHVNIFNRNIIGRKNLNLMERNTSSNSSTSDDSSSESEGNLSPDWVEKSNETVIFNKKPAETPKRTYCLRNRILTNKEIGAIEKPEIAVKNKKPTITKHTKNVGKKTVTVKSESSAGKDEIEDENPNEKGSEALTKDSKSVNSRSIPEDLQKELKEKLVRTRSQIKKDEKPMKKNYNKPSKTLCEKEKNFMKIKLVSPIKNKKKVFNSKKKNSQKEVKDRKSDSVEGITFNHSVSRKAVEDVKNTTVKHVLKDFEKNDKTASDIEAQNLIEGLKERGIHLMKNRSSSNKGTNGSCDSSKHHKNSICKKDTCSEIVQNKFIDKHEISTTELETELRDTYDTKTFEEEYERVVHNESKKVSKTFADYDIKVLEKTFVGKVLIEESNEEIDVPVVVTPFHLLLDILPDENLTQNSNAIDQKIKANKKVEEKPHRNFTLKNESNKGIVSDNILASNHTVYFVEDKNDTESPSVKKRKVEKDDCRVPEEKECKNLLQQINVDKFLNNIHGEN